MVNKIYGIWIVDKNDNCRWLEDHNGLIFHTEYFNLAVATYNENAEAYIGWNKTVQVAVIGGDGEPEIII